jgi:hypothetical protein
LVGAGGASSVGAVAPSSAGASSLGGAAAFLAAAFFEEAFLDALFLAAAFLAGFGSSGCTSRMRPSRSALRRTRSAWGSTTLDEWLFTPMPSASQRSMHSLFVRPSSRASS